MPICSQCSIFIYSGTDHDTCVKQCQLSDEKRYLKIHRMPMKYFESRTYGEVLSRVTNDVDTLGQSLNQSMTQIITSATQIVGVFIMMIGISIPMTIAVLLTLPLSMGLIGLIMSKSQPYFKAQQKYLGELNGQVEEI